MLPVRPMLLPQICQPALRALVAGWLLLLALPGCGAKEVTPRQTSTKPWVCRCSARPGPRRHHGTNGRSTAGRPGTTHR